MQLNSANLSELVRALRSNVAAGEKRKHPRVGLRSKAAIIVDRRSIPVWVRDISAGGANFSCPQVLEAGCQFKLALSETDTIECVVRHCRKNSSTSFSVGVKFTQDVARRRASQN